MPRFNTVISQPTAATTNLAGGKAFSVDAKNELAMLVLTSLLKDQFYRPSKDAIAQLDALIENVDPVFAAKAAVYARRTHGLRSISHLIAARLASKKFEGKRAFYATVVRRPDDITEILAAYGMGKVGTDITLPNSLKRGLADSFAQFDGYQIGKYRGADHTVKLVDAVNMLRPRPTERNRDAMKALIEGKLTQDATWESQISALRKDDYEARDKVWGELLGSGRLGYMAALKNARNIHNDHMRVHEATPTMARLIALLTDEKAIRRSLVFPYRFLRAYRELQSEAGARPILSAISQAATLALSNVPVFEGKTAILLDSSGSMTSQGLFTKMAGPPPIEIAGMFAVSIMKRNPNADMYLFDTQTRMVNVTAESNVIETFDGLRPYIKGGGTDLGQAFALLPMKYDRIIILSDMQSWTESNGSPDRALMAYKTKFDADPIVHSFDVTGYGTIQFPQHKLHMLAGISDKAFEVMQYLEADRHAMVHIIESTPLHPSVPHLARIPETEVEDDTGDS